MTPPPDPPVTPDGPDQEIGPFTRDDVVAGFQDLAAVVAGAEADHLGAADWRTLAMLTLAANSIVESPGEQAAAPGAAGMATAAARPAAFGMGRRRPPYRSVRVR